MCHKLVLVTVLTFLHPREDDQGDSIGRKETNINQKLQKVFLVALSHTVVDPRAVVVHATDTPLTDPAVMGSWRSVRLTTSTDGPFFLGALFLESSVKL